MPNQAVHKTCCRQRHTCLCIHDHVPSRHNIKHTAARRTSMRSSGSAMVCSNSSADTPACISCTQQCSSIDPTAAHASAARDTWHTMQPKTATGLSFSHHPLGLLGLLQLLVSCAVCVCAALIVPALQLHGCSACPMLLLVGHCPRRTTHKVLLYPA